MANLLKNILSGLSMFGGSGEESAVGIDIGSSAIKVVEIKKKKGKAVLETYGSITLGPYAGGEVGTVTNLPIEKVIEALKEVLKQSGTVTSSAALAIPVQSALIFSLELPPGVGEGELAQVVPTEARKYIPVPIDEVSIDYFLLPRKEPSYEEMNKEPAGKVREKKSVLVVATQNEAVSRYRTIVSECKLSSSFFEIEVFSSVRSNFEHELSPVLLMDFGASRTKLSLVEFGVIKNYHSIDRGGADISDSISKSLGVPFAEAEKMKKEFGLFGNPNEKNLAEIIRVHLDYIFSEANNTLIGYEKKYNSAVSKVILSGGGSLLPGLKGAAEENFRVEIELGRPFGKLQAPTSLDRILADAGGQFAVAIGLALRKIQ